MENLNWFLQCNLSETSADPFFDCFGNKTPPPINVYHYMEHLSYYLHLTDHEWMIATTYLQRVLRLRPQLSLTASNIHRLLLCCAVAAYKQSRDSLLTNAQISCFAGVNLKELNFLECRFLEGIHWDLSSAEVVYLEPPPSSGGESTQSKSSSDEDLSSLEEATLSELLFFK